MDQDAAKASASAGFGWQIDGSVQLMPSTNADLEHAVRGRERRMEKAGYRASQLSRIHERRKPKSQSD